MNDELKPDDERATDGQPESGAGSGEPLESAGTDPGTATPETVTPAAATTDAGEAGSAAVEEPGGGEPATEAAASTAADATAGETSPTGEDSGADGDQAAEASTSPEPSTPDTPGSAEPSAPPPAAATSDPPAAPTSDPPAAATSDPPAAPTSDPPAAATSDPPAAPTSDPPAAAPTTAEASPGGEAASGVAASETDGQPAATAPATTGDTTGTATETARAATDVAGAVPAADRAPRDDRQQGERPRSGRSGRRRGNRKMHVPQLDLRDQHQELKREIAHAIAEVINTGTFILGPKVAALEVAVAHYSSARYGIGVASGTDALLLSLRALGIGPGDEVITSVYSFIASAGSIALSGAKPVFVDIDPENWNIDPAGVEAKITDKTKAIMPVHLFGQCAPMEPLLEIAARRNLAIIEDAAQALGAEDNSRRAGSLGTLGCFSFYPTKNLGGMGDGGMIVTNDEELADRLRLIRVHGAKPKYINRVLGTNSRLDAIQAAVLIVKLQHLEQYTEARRQHARAYNERLKELTCTGPKERPRSRHIYNQYAIRVENRDQVAEKLKEKGIDTAVYYPIPLHLQEVFADLGHQAGDFPHAEEAARTTLCLPIFPELSKRARDYVATQLADIVGRQEQQEAS